MRTLGVTPRIFYTPNSAEYWRGDGSLAHIDGLGEHDRPEAHETRTYHLSGTQHGAGSLPQRDDSGTDGTRGLYGYNVVDYAVVPAELEVHLIMDNYGTHKTALIQRWLAKRPRYHVHFTPTSASWLNLVERFFAELTNKQLRRGVFRSTEELERAIRRYLELRNADPKPFTWTKSADEILASIARFCQLTSDSGH